MQVPKLWLSHIHDIFLARIKLNHKAAKWQERVIFSLATSGVKILLLLLGALPKVEDGPVIVLFSSAIDDLVEL